MDQIFTCQQWKIDRAIAHNATSFCIAEKSLLISSILIAFLICQQLYVYEVLLRVKISDLRILILLMCIFNQINNFIHYNLKASQQCSTFITIEMFRFIIFFSSYGLVSKSDAIIAICLLVDVLIPRSIAPPTNGLI